MYEDQWTKGGDGIVRWNSIGRVIPIDACERLSIPMNLGLQEKAVRTEADDWKSYQSREVKAIRSFALRGVGHSSHTTLDIVSSRR